MPLPVASAEALSIPETAFNADGLAVLAIPGGRYGGDWSISFMAGDVNCGSLSTSVDDRRKRELQSDPGYPDRAIETAFIWLIGQTREQGLRVVGWECFNSRYAEAERQFFCLARAIVAGKAFIPAPGVTYADEMTLDAAMGYVNPS
jgi:hypothetical protein